MARGALLNVSRHAPGPGLIQYNAGFYFHIECNSLHLFLKLFKNENKGIVLKARLVYTA